MFFKQKELDRLEVKVTVRRPIWYAETLSVYLGRKRVRGHINVVEIGDSVFYAARLDNKDYPQRWHPFQAVEDLVRAQLAVIVEEDF